MRCKMIMLEGGKIVRCASPNCCLVKGLVICRSEFSYSEVLEHDVLSFCKKSCYDAYYALYPVFSKIAQKK